MSKINIRHSNLNEFKPIRLVIEIDIESKKEYDDLKTDIVDYQNEWGFEGVILSQIMNELDNFIK